MENKAVMVSIKPKWCNLIANEEKKIEIRKTKPNLKVPFKCFIYCTKDKWLHLNQLPDKSYRISNGKDYGKYDKDLKFLGEANGKVIGEFICDRISEYPYISDSINESTYNKNNESFYSIPFVDCGSICLTPKDLLDYGNGKTLYGWHISDLVLYDKPKEINDFITPTKNIECYETGKCYKCKYFELGNDYSLEDDCNAPFDTDYFKPLFRAPQSWCFVNYLD